MIDRPLHVLTCAVLSLAPTAGRAQAMQPEPSCNGRTITRVDVDPGRPPFAGAARKWQLVARALGLHHAVTRSDVIRTYLLFKRGDVCSDERVAESERVLRGLPFLAGATAHVQPDDANGVVVEIQTTDEVPVLVSASLHGGVPSALSLGNDNVGGLGLTAIVGGELGGHYRNGMRIAAADAAPFDEPVEARFDAERDRLGDQVAAEVSHRFLSNVQRGAWNAAFRSGDDYPLIVRPAGDDESVEVHDENWSVSGAVRSVIDSTVWLWGPVALGARETPTDRVIVVSSAGPVAANDSALLARFSAFHSVRLGALLGARRVRYDVRTGLDALFAAQDVMTGWQFGAMAAPGATSARGRDLLIANGSSFGATRGATIILGDLEAEARRDFPTGSWQSVVANAHLTADHMWAPRVVANLKDDFSILSRPELATQLSLGDATGGPRGYAGSRIAGGRRNVARIEVRWATPNAVQRADLGVALFADAGTIWAGGAPYGVSATREGVGISLLAAYPTRTKHLYRLDLAVPLQRGGSRGLEIRFTSGDPTSGGLTEPPDVTRARLAPIPSSLFAWTAP